MPTPPPDGLEITTALLCQELWGGGFFVAPVADASLACRGDTLAACLSEQRLFLEEHLVDAAPEVLARFSSPKKTELLVIEVAAPRPDLPKRLAIPGKVALACVLVPFAEESWAFLPALGHAVRVEKSGRRGPGGEADRGSSNRGDVVEVVTADAERLIAALELPPGEYLQLLPPRRQSLEWLTLKLRRSDLETADKARAARKKAVKAKRTAEAAEILGLVATPMHERKEARGGPALLCRERELKELGALLGAKERTGVMLVGPELCGKSALVDAWLRGEQKAGRPRQVWATSASRLIAGMSGLGQWQERVRRVVDAAAELDAVLYFENLGDLLAQHASESLDVAGALKPALDSGRVRLVGEIAPDSLDLLEARHAGFLGTLARLRVDPLDARSTERVLAERVSWAAEHQPDLPNLDLAAVPRLVELVERYLPYRAFPGKAVRLLDELRAAHLGDRAPDGKPRRLGASDVYALFSLKTGVPEFLLREDRALVASEVKRAFQEELVGQDDAVRRVVETLCEVKAGLQPGGKPLATFLFVGPTGVGKTELARLLAAFLFGSPDRLFRFDMSEFADAYSAARLFQGNERAEGLLTRRVRQQPFCVLLLDEIEKAHSGVFDLLLQLLGEGRLTDARGRTAFFHNALVVMTSNLGAAHRHSALGIGASTEDDARHYRREVEKAFRPELVNRIDHIVSFAPLGPDEAKQVTRMVVERVRERRGLRGAGATLEVDEATLSALAKGGHQPAYGARALRRYVEDRLVSPMALGLAQVEVVGRGACVRAKLENESLVVEVERGAGQGDRGALKPVIEVQEERRFADRLFGIDAVEQLREQISVLVAQLSSAEGRGARAAAGTIARQRGDHQRMEAVLREAETLRAGLEAAEELSLLAFFGRDDPAPFVAEGKDLVRRLRRAAPGLLLALEPRHDEITLLLQEADEARALDVWLAPLLAEAKRRRWTIEGRPGLTCDKARRKRRWNAITGAGALAIALDAGDRDFREVLLHVRGPNAGLLLALESGLHRFLEVDPKIEIAHLYVEALSMRAEISEEEVEGSLAQPHPLAQARQLALMPALRVRDAEGKVAIVVKERKLALDPTAYWKDFEEVALEHLLQLELGDKDGFDREATYRQRPLDVARAAKEARR